MDNTLHRPLEGKSGVANDLRPGCYEKITTTSVVLFTKCDLLLTPHSTHTVIWGICYYKIVFTNK